MNYFSVYTVGDLIDEAVESVLKKMENVLESPEDNNEVRQQTLFLISSLIVDKMSKVIPTL